MESIRVTCKNEEEVIKVLEIAEKEGYAWSDGSEATGYRPYVEYPYALTLYKGIVWGAAEDEERRIARNFEKSYIAQDFITEYNSGNVEPFGISQKIKNEIIMDFIKKWREIRVGCAVRTCRTCKFFRNIAGSTVCKLDDIDDATSEETFFGAVKLLMDVVTSGDPCTWKLTSDEAIEVLEEEIKASEGMKDSDAQKRVTALKMAVRALEEKENGFRAKGD